jgi:predicted alpha/beta superfamily hydrolase
VLYLQDGQKLFGEAGESWGLQQVLDAEIGAGRIAPLVVVGVDHGGGDGERDPVRVGEYTPVRDGQYGGGSGENYGRMLVEEILPWVGRQFRVRKGREQTGVGGASLGALMSLYVGIENRKVFGRIAALSPSLWWGGEWIYRYLEGVGKNVTPRPRIWLDMGEREGATHVARAEKVIERLRGAGWKMPEQLHFHRDAQGEHHEGAWGGRLGEVLQFLFPA